MSLQKVTGFSATAAKPSESQHFPSFDLSIVIPTKLKLSDPESFAMQKYP